MAVVIRRWVWLECIGMVKGAVVRKYIDFLIILPIPAPHVLALFGSSTPTSLFILKMLFHSLYMHLVGNGTAHHAYINNRQEHFWRYSVIYLLTHQTQTNQTSLTGFYGSILATTLVM